MGCVNSVLPANQMFCDVRPNLRTPRGELTRAGPAELAQECGTWITGHSKLLITPMSVAAPAASAAATSSSLSKLPQLELVPVADEPRAGPRRRGRALPGRTRPPRRPARSSGSVVVRSCRRLGICRRYGEVGSSGGLRCRIRGCCLGGGTARGCPAATARALTGARPASAAWATGGARTRSRRGGSRAGCGSALAGACAPR